MRANADIAMVSKLLWERAAIAIPSNVYRRLVSTVGSEAVNGCR
jgi:hypothetical protein